MNVIDYLHEEKKLQRNLLKFIESDEDCDKYYQKFIKYFEKLKIEESHSDLQRILNSIIHITNNHRRYSNFYGKINQIFLYFKSIITQNFSNLEIYNLFNTNNCLLLFLFKENMLIFDYQIICHLIELDNLFFLPEIKTFIEQNKKDEILSSFNSTNKIINIIKNDKINDFLTEHERFEENRQEGENEQHICYLIRNDLIEQFIEFINRNQISHSAIITPSIFETNFFLINKKVSLIEYAAFFGSIQIFQYLQFNKVELYPSLWYYSIHGRNPEIIHLLENLHVKPLSDSDYYGFCFSEAIEFHHNEIADYIKNNYFNEKDNSYQMVDNLFTSFRLYNYDSIPDDINQHLLFCYLCKFNFTKIVKLLLENKGFDFNINDSIISF